MSSYDTSWVRTETAYRGQRIRDGIVGRRQRTLLRRERTLRRRGMQSGDL
jgi:hypothetical protein